MNTLRWLAVGALAVVLAACAPRFGSARFVPAPIPGARTSPADIGAERLTVGQLIDVLRNCTPMACTDSIGGNRRCGCEH